MTAELDPTALVLSLERAFPVAEWMYRDVHLWPSIRQLVWMSAHRRNCADGPVAPSPLRRGYANLAEGELRWARARWKDRAQEAARRGPSDVVLLSGGGVDRFQLTDGSWFDRHCDPLVALIHAEGASTVQLDPHHAYRVPRHRPSRLVQARLDALKALAMWPAPSPLPLPGLDGLDAALSANGLQLGVRPERLARYLDLVAGWTERLLRRHRSRLAIFLDWNAASLGFALGARRAGVLSVEIQHGIHGRQHPHYGAWDVVPPGGYSVHPDIYWIWTDSEVLVPDWALPGQRSSVIVGGNPLLEAALDQPRPTGGAQLDPGATCRVLVTLQPGLQGRQHLGPLLDAIQASPTDWVWWVRHHPRSSSAERQALEGMLDGAGATVEVERVSCSPLVTLLAYADAHVTVSSSVVLEARVMGVRSIVLDGRDGPELFQADLLDGWAQLASTGSEVIAGVAEAHRRRERMRSPSGLPLRAIRHLLGTAA